MKQLCGCCEGIEHLTPASTANRPGLGALAYRVGTHGSFLETMLARLSSHALKPTNPDGSDTPGQQSAHPLQSLTTRDAHDASIAFLDAWATVADVLTFYQERIANEGYLRTAVERRSVLELARLIGYKPRPGVAASVYLAYTLEDGSKVTIPAGSRSQSVPGPDELPQTFETSEDLEAQAVWNLLQARLTRPQAPQPQLLANGKPLYFKGTATNLKPNDPLLVDSGVAATRPFLLRVTRVEPDQANDRTKVTVEEWERPPAVTAQTTTATAATTAAPPATAATAPPSTSATAPPSTSATALPPDAGALAFTTETASVTPAAEAEATRAEHVGKARAVIAERARVENFDVDPEAKTARRVLELLDESDRRLTAARTLEEVRDILDESLATLREEQKLAARFVKLKPWIVGTISELKRVRQGIPEDASAEDEGATGVEVSAAGGGEGASFAGGGASALPSLETSAAEASVEAASAIAHALAREPFDTQTASAASSASVNVQPPSAGQQGAQSSVQPALANISPALLDELDKPPSVQPASRQQLGQGFAQTFSPTSGTLTKMLTTLRPGLRDAFNSSWGNVPVTDPTPARVYALRTRAAVFGNNALPETLFDDENRIKGQREWTLFRTTGRGTTEHFVISLRSFVDLENPVEEGGIPRIAVRVEIRNAAGTATHAEGLVSLIGGEIVPLIVPLPNAENVNVTVQTSSESPNKIIFFNFKQRKVVVRVELDPGSGIRVDSTGSNPTAFIHDLNTVTSTISVVQSRTFLTVEGDIRRAEGNEPTERPDVVSLDASYNQILPGGWAVLERPTPLGTSLSRLVIRKIVRVGEGSRADYGVTVKGTRLELDGPWIAPVLEGGDQFDVIRGTTVLAQSELLELAEEPLDPVGEDVCGDRIELAGLVEGLEPGRRLVVSGERTDIARAGAPSASEPDASGAGFPKAGVNSLTGAAAAAGTTAGAGGTEGAGAADAGAETLPGVKAAELVMLAGVEQGYDPSLPGDRTHTTLLLARPLAYCYRRDTLRIYGNVAHATHGETRAEVLGSGDAGKPSQSFTLKQSPLTYVSAPTPSGVASTLAVRVNEVLWHEADTLAGAAPKDRVYAAKTDDEDATTVAFGNGREGARPSTGQENIAAVYRTGIGKGGNVRAGQISMVLTKPLGVKEVSNPLAASGGAGREERDQMRRNAPLAVMSLDRLVSTRDYEDFARTFAGVGKASAARLSDGRRHFVHLTVAGEDDIPIGKDSDLYKNLRAALGRFGDPFQPVRVEARRLKLLVVGAKVRAHPDYLWESVEPRIRAAMLERFSFARRDLGQDVVLSEVTATIQSVEGVLYVDVDTLDEIAEDIWVEGLLQIYENLTLKVRVRADLARVDKEATGGATRVRPAQLALLSALVPETLNLTELKR